MLGTLWYCGVGIDPGRLIDDTDPAYYLTVMASYRQMCDMRAQEAAEMKSVTGP